MTMRYLALFLCAGLSLTACDGSKAGDSAPAGQAADSSEAATLTRDAAIGEKYGAPGPRRCSSRSSPQTGALSSRRARAYVICDLERVFGADQDLYLVTNADVQVSAGRPYNDLTDSSEAVDTSQLVYDIRGSSVDYQCHPAELTPDVSKRCRVYRNANASGKCIRTTFGEWHCTWTDATLPLDTNTDHVFPPPSLEAAD